jgi:hypothetical protein
MNLLLAFNSLCSTFESASRPGGPENHEAQRCRWAQNIEAVICTHPDLSISTDIIVCLIDIYYYSQSRRFESPVDPPA